MFDTREVKQLKRLKNEHITNIIRTFQKYNKKEWNYCDDLVGEEPLEFINYLFEKEPTDFEFEKLGQLCRERAVQLYELLQPNKNYINFMKEIEENKQNEKFRFNHLWRYHRQIYNLNKLALIFTGTELL